ncbi:hypothetical protein PoB_000643700 [Plakobranchus ocellatus]|uniref:Uncharacterized protein n=1 Tax=Plakobranchus ocellatus TaxID=259542 RepID=A0AAV3YBY7_9GAST|nr:hypothetical protein PoB_000643700 [Plakobranchus ocellatus]
MIFSLNPPGRKAGCLLHGQCFRLGHILHLQNGTYECVRVDKYKIHFEKVKKECNNHGVVYKHNKTFYSPPEMCQLYQCNDGNVQYLRPVEEVGCSVASESALRCAETFLSRVRGLPPAPWPDGGLKV